MRTSSTDPRGQDHDSGANQSRKKSSDLRLRDREQACKLKATKGETAMWNVTVRDWVWHILHKYKERGLSKWYERTSKIRLNLGKNGGFLQPMLQSLNHRSPQRHKLRNRKNHWLHSLAIFPDDPTEIQKETGMRMEEKLVRSKSCEYSLNPTSINRRLQRWVGMRAKK